MLLKKMKASLAIALVASMSLLAACGGGAEKKADTTEKAGETQAAKASGGNVLEVATVLDVNFTNIYNKIKECER